MKNDARYPAIGVIHHRDALHPTPPAVASDAPTAAGMPRNDAISGSLRGPGVSHTTAATSANQLVPSGD